MNKKLYFIIPVLTILGLVFPLTTQMQAQPVLKATGAPDVFKVTVTKVEVWNGSSWVTIFSGTSQLDLVAGGTFPGIQELPIPAGTYSQMRCTFKNSFPFKGQLTYDGMTYYTTSPAFNPGGGENTGSLASTIGPAQECTIRNPFWGAMGADVVYTWDITPFRVTPATDHESTIVFDVSSSLLLYKVDSNFFFILSPPSPTVG